jgi:hypothetical protein
MNTDGPAGVLGHQQVEPLAQAQDVLGMNFDVRRLALEAAERLVDHHVGIGQGDALALRPRREQERSHRRRHSDAQRRHVGLDELHRVVDRKARRDRAPRRVDVEVDVLVRVFRLEEQHLRNDQVRRCFVDRADEEHDPFLEQPRIDVVSALAAPALLDHHRDQPEALGLFHGSPGFPG